MNNFYKILGLICTSILMDTAVLPKKSSSDAIQLMKADNFALSDEFRGNFNLALKTYFQEICINPNFSKIRFYKGGELTNWSGLPGVSKWKGESLENKTIYVDAEKTCSTDDALLFVRFLPLLFREGAKVYVKFSSELQDLFFDKELMAKIVRQDDEISGIKFDYFTSIMSIPHYWQVDLGFACGVPINICVDAKRLEELKSKYFKNNKLKIGICWKCSLEHKDRDRHSLDFKYFEKIAKIDGVKIYSLQQGDEDLFRDQSKPEWLEDLSSINKTLSDFTAIIKNLDIVITTDGIIPHLSCMLGKSTWLFLPNITEWKWFCYAEKDSSIWYENLHKFNKEDLVLCDFISDLVVKRLNDDAVKVLIKD